MKIFSFILIHFFAFFQLIFGKFSWENPHWMNHLRYEVRTKPTLFLMKIIIVFLCIATSFYAYHWYISLPKPETISIKITPPKQTPIAKILTPDTLTLDFGVKIHDTFDPRSVAPLQLIGKNVSENITLTPQIIGDWRWETDSRLRFKPSTDWPADTAYHVEFNKKFFSTGIKFARYNTSFQTLPLTASLTEFKFYQDPLHENVKEIVATITFSFPIDAEWLNKNLRLEWQDSKKNLPYRLTFDENKRTAYLHRDMVSLPQSPRYLTLKIKNNHSFITQTLLIPDANNFLKISNISTEIVRNAQDKPEQILTIETTLGVTSSQLAKYLHAYLLPKDYPKTVSEETKVNYKWTNPGEITDTILKLATPLNLKALPADRENATVHSYQYHAKTPAYLYLKIDKGLRAWGDFTLENTYTTILNVPVYPQEISFLHKGALLALGTEEKLSFLAYGMNDISFPCLAM